jgi:hypothetical protein
VILSTNQGGTVPKIVDPTTPGRSYEFPAPWIHLNEDTAERFLSAIAERRVPASALSQLMSSRRETNEQDDLLDFAPCLLVDFDQRRLFSQYPEMIRFELYVPDGWIGIYRDFRSEVPPEERYWIVNGQNFFEKQ